MKYFCALLLIAAPALGVDADATIQSISLTGAQNYQLSQGLVAQLQRLIGQKFNQQALDDLARGIGNELGGHSVSQKVTSGDQPDQVRVVLEVLPQGEARQGSGEEPELNVNARYTVEDVHLTGPDQRKLTKELKQELQKLVGEKFNQEALDELKRRIKKELRIGSITQKVTRGEKPEHVKVELELSSGQDREAEINLSKVVYHAKQGWSATVVGDFNIAPQTSLLLGIASNGDDLLERYAGLMAGFESKRVVTDRLRLRFLFQTFHEQWNRATLAALESANDGPGIYRTRKSFEPTLTVSLARPLTLSAGTSLQLVQTQFPTARTEAANAAVGGLRYHQRFEDSQNNKHDLEASYEVRAAGRTFDSDFVYTRHQFHAGYKIAGPRQAVVSSFTLGRLSGRAPLYERYSVGNSTTLRGWNKFDVSPLGGDRVVNHSLEYRHAIDGREEPVASLIAFYDVGAVWNHGERAVVRHAVGGGVRIDMFFLTLAFPVRSGRMEPIFMMGTTF
ncbi:MAG: BamA/TamA family outer membrane protein [Acidobacteria bacterium]|nr:BamA/TamA family outer membrane protein [Acidobacteriota bacterium]